MIKPQPRLLRTSKISNKKIMLYIILRLLAGIDLLIWGILFFIHSIKTIDELKGNISYGQYLVLKFGQSFLLLLAAFCLLSATFDLM